jgi:hypothetical protein
MILSRLHIASSAELAASVSGKLPAGGVRSLGRGKTAVLTLPTIPDKNGKCRLAFFVF